MKKEIYESLYNISVIGQEEVTLDEYNSTPEERRVSIIASSENGLVYEEIEDDEDVENLKLAMLAKQTSYLKTIKACAVFFTVLTITGMICGFILAMAL